MNRDDIIRMAQEAGLCDEEGRDDSSVIIENHLKRFAALVAAEEREAMVAEAAKKGWGMRNDDPFEDCVREIAAIRARGNT